jgi:hypothetical protein
MAYSAYNIVQTLACTKICLCTYVHIGCLQLKQDEAQRAMAVTSEQSAPYVAPGVFIPLLDRNREKGLPNPLTGEALQRLGVSDSLVLRTLQTFKILDLIGEDGRHTDLLEGFRRAPEADYQPMMAEWLKGAYEHDLDVIDPATADDIAIRDAFRHYSPISMQPRMITLFTALFEAAGVRATDRPKGIPKKPANAPAARTSRPPPSRQVMRAYDGVPARPQAPAVGGLHPALAGLLASLPSAATGWTQEARDRWYVAFGVVLDLALPPGVVAANPQTAESYDADA